MDRAVIDVCDHCEICATCADSAVLADLAVCDANEEGGWGWGGTPPPLFRVLAALPKIRPPETSTSPLIPRDSTDWDPQEFHKLGSPGIP